MWPLRAFRENPYFAPIFDAVPVLFWPILWWSLNRLIRLYKDGGYEQILYTVSPWGIVRIRYSAKKPDPRLYRPIPRTFRPLTDASWGSDLPANIDVFVESEAKRDALLHRFSGGLPGSAIASRSPREGINDSFLDSS